MTSNESPGFIVLDGQKIAVESAKFSISVQTEAWIETRKKWLYGPEHLQVDYRLSIKVNEESGEDGAPYPEAEVIPVFRAAGERHPFISDLPGLTVDDQGDWEAWFGNDAPPLEENRLTFVSWDAKSGRMTLEWNANYSERDVVKPFHFSGSAEFEGIRLSVKAAEDADAFFEQVFGKEYRARVTKHVGEWRDHGEAMPADRRRWLPIHYKLA